ncbi:Holliday junction resolvase RuvX [Bacteroidales bacterium OttesenSCG-928-K03]|nr:Holliday junction resolvase RuvX [Odoribacter sp. OttesenSCG-928-L07]MDL2238824.1 Holliday junction resolvase RuvX [Bacteroidales bacterium OttesenSCG-928-L14]MDL2240243.1 Holliday junction resolvase RuvX [Bacteroidales bacterium OttesenSCG-928-K22]MDL2242421.1 Holliday junction resolvase RuvX [Bacteroidales bacterium OttesenSCG-928-K03]
MGRLFAIDYGKKRVGIAVSDELKIIATALTTVSSNDIFSFIEGYLKDNQIDAFIVGYATDMSGKDSQSMQYITPFVNRLKKLYPQIPVNMVDERFTSKMAQEAILMSGAKKSKRQDKSLVDRVSATIILQTYMECDE